MAAEATNGSAPETIPATSTIGKKDAPAVVEAAQPTAPNGDASKEVSAPQAETEPAAPAAAGEKDADSSKSTGDNKHERDDADKETDKEAGVKAPAAKKQKTDGEPAKAANGTETKTAANGEKKRGPGRPKKGEGKTTEKKAPKQRSTEGIGSRTRSRAQA
ncbi:hypothetical protein FQN51_003477 [Onygenales sp. PD_10]|nr:hypothetical protein FQN51_003477 [Onygenales sp. PD_10]